jgi:hypothetical protein
VTLFLAAMTIAWLALGGAQNWVKADLATTRLLPSAFPELPSPIQKELERRGCTIPQPQGATHANVI